jgi:fatty-acid desaturase
VIVLAMTSATATKAKSSRRPWWLSQPSTAFLRDPHFYTKYDIVWSALAISISATLWFALDWRGFDVAFTMANAPLLAGLFVVAAYLQIMAGVFIHNGAHENFARPVNRLWSELMGSVVCTRFASWEILHRYHHMHTDDTTLDPHPVNAGFWRFFFSKMVMGLEKNLRHQYLERWGDTPETRARDTRRTLYSGATGLLLVGTWFVLLGPVLFLVVFLPALICGAVHVSHFNWVTHNAAEGEGADFRPTNLDSGVYWFANRVLFGLYMHANHHAYLKLFNPLKIPSEQVGRVDQKISTHRVRRGLSE